jgi:alanine racemase
MYAGASLHIDAQAIAQNTRHIAARTGAAIMAVVKADGFGHGDAALAALRNGASWLGVTSIDEALPFRWRGIDAPMLSWLNPLDADFAAAIRHDIDVAVPSLRHLASIQAAARRVGRRANVHLHLDSGMSRDGIDRSEWNALCELARLGEAAGLLKVRGIMSHLAVADHPGDPATRYQTLLFENAVRAARHRRLDPSVVHLAATAATLTDTRTHFGMVRVGAGLYGIDPSHSTSREVPLRGAMTLSAPVTLLREVPAGTGVGYGLSYRTDRRTRLALLPIGYADGVPRSLDTRAGVQLNGRRVPVAGTVSMDQVVLDIGDLAVAPGDRATLFGPGDAGEPTLSDWASWAGTIEHELVTRIGPRVSREHLSREQVGRERVAA